MMQKNKVQSSRSQTMRDAIFKDFKFYQKPQIHKVTTQQYQQRRGHQQYNSFRRKKQTTFFNHSYSSALNPFARGKGRQDKAYKETFERKQRNKLFSNHYTNPISLIYQPPPTIPRVRPQHHINFGTKSLAEIKYELPASRVISPAHKRYFCQSGFSNSLERNIKPRNSLVSKEMKRTIQYGQANHFVQRVTGKVGQK